MYDEFPTVYETSLELKWMYFIVLGAFLFVVLIISLISLAKIFKKANRSGISAFIPFYNLVILLEITNSPKWYFLFLLIPGINFIFYVIIMFSLASSFRKNKLFALGLTFLPFVFYPILGFSNSEYIGINLEAMEGKTINVDIPRIVDTDGQQPIVHEEKDTSLENINISIGGGVYQKDYTNTLLQVDEEQAVSNSNELLLSSNSIPRDSFSNRTNPTNLTFIHSMEGRIEPSNKDFINLTNQFPNPVDFHYHSTNSSINSMGESTMNSIGSIITPNNLQKETENKNMAKLDSFSSPNISSEENSQFISCPKCGTKLKSDSRICFLCGKRFE